MTKLWHAKETAAAISAAISPPVSTKTMYTQITDATETLLQAVMRNVTISQPEGQVELENFLGADTNDFQNTELSYKPFGLGTMTGTLVVRSTVALEPFFMGSTGTPITTTETGTRYQPGKFTAVKERQNSAIGINLTEVGTLNLSANVLSIDIVLNNCILTKVGDYKLSGADGTWEVDFEAKCLPKDFYVEFRTV